MAMTVDNAYRRVKQESKVLLEQSRDVVSRMNPELREEYNEIESKRLEYDKACRAAQQEGRRPPSAEGVDVRSLEELQTELETQKANLELNLMTNPGVVEQYERRKQEVSRSVCFQLQLTQSIAGERLTEPRRASKKRRRK